jgi:hypothetical protein
VGRGKRKKEKVTQVSNFFNGLEIFHQLCLSRFLTPLATKRPKTR